MILPDVRLVLRFLSSTFVRIRVQSRHSRSSIGCPSAQTVKQLERRNRKQLKEVVTSVLQRMMDVIRKNRREMYTDGDFSICR